MYVILNILGKPRPSLYNRYCMWSALNIKYTREALAQPSLALPGPASNRYCSYCQLRGVKVIGDEFHMFSVVQHIQTRGKFCLKVCVIRSMYYPMDDLFKLLLSAYGSEFCNMTFLYVLVQ